MNDTNKHTTVLGRWIHDMVVLGLLNDGQAEACARLAGEDQAAAVKTAEAKGRREAAEDIYAKWESESSDFEIDKWLKQQRDACGPAEEREAARILREQKAEIERLTRELEEAMKPSQPAPVCPEEEHAHFSEVVDPVTKERIYKRVPCPEPPAQPAPVTTEMDKIERWSDRKIREFGDFGTTWVSLSDAKHRAKNDQAAAVEAATKGRERDRLEAETATLRARVAELEELRELARVLPVRESPFQPRATRRFNELLYNQPKGSE